MTFSLTGLLRSLGILAILLSVVAIGLGRLATEPANFRIRTAGGCVPIDGYHFPEPRNVPRFLDPKTGEWISVEFSEGDSLDHATCSPWHDDQGETQVVGRSINRSSVTGLFEGYGMARYTFPGGVAIDFVPLEVVPVSAPCFYPGSASRILFAAGDGRLYHLTFDDPDGKGTEPDRAKPRALPVLWKCAPPSGDHLLLEDPTWPADSKFGNRVIVALSILARSQRIPNYLRSRLWWLQLNADGTEILAAGPLIEQRTKEAVEERMPSVTTTPDGGLTLAYLVRPSPDFEWHLGLAPIHFGANGNPTVEEASTRELPGPCRLIPPPFSADRRHVYHLTRTDHDSTRSGRSPEVGALHHAAVSVLPAWNSGRGLAP